MSNPFAPPNSDMTFALTAATVALAALGGSETPPIVGWAGIALAVVAPTLVVDEITRRRS